MTIRELIERLEDELDGAEDRDILMSCRKEGDLWELRQVELVIVSNAVPHRKGPVRHLALSPGELYEEPPCDYSS